MKVKRLLAMVMCLIMVACMLPITGAAEGEVLEIIGLQGDEPIVVYTKLEYEGFMMLDVENGSDEYLSEIEWTVEDTLPDGLSVEYSSDMTCLYIKGIPTTPTDEPIEINVSAAAVYTPEGAEEGMELTASAVVAFLVQEMPDIDKFMNVIYAADCAVPKRFANSTESIIGWLSEEWISKLDIEGPLEELGIKVEDLIFSIENESATDFTAATDDADGEFDFYIYYLDSENQKVALTEAKDGYIKKDEVGISVNDGVATVNIPTTDIGDTAYAELTADDAAAAVEEAVAEGAISLKVYTDAPDHLQKTETTISGTLFAEAVNNNLNAEIEQGSPISQTTLPARSLHRFYAIMDRWDILPALLPLASFVFTDAHENGKVRMDLNLGVAMMNMWCATREYELPDEMMGKVQMRYAYTDYAADSEEEGFNEIALETAFGANEMSGSVTPIETDNGTVGDDPLSKTAKYVDENDATYDVHNIWYADMEVVNPDTGEQIVGGDLRMEIALWGELFNYADKVVAANIGDNPYSVEVTADKNNKRIYAIKTDVANFSPFVAYALDKVGYTITLDENGGNPLNIETVETDDSGRVGTLPTPTRGGGYVFEGWYTAKNGGKKVTTNTVFDEDTTIYARWTTLYNLGGGLGAGGLSFGSGVAAGAKKTITEEVEWANPFVDVDEDDWFYEDVRFVSENKLMNGTANSMFAPNEFITRAMLVTVIWRMEGSLDVGDDPGVVPFADVQTGAYYEDAVAWAQANGIVKGYSDTEFGPGDNLTREQIAAIIYRYADYKGIMPLGSWAIGLEYEDTDQISQYAVEPVMYCTMKEIMTGKEINIFAPQDFATRAEIAAILHRFIESNK